MNLSFFRFLGAVVLTQLTLAGSLSAIAAVTPKTTPLTFQYTRDQLEPFKSCPIPNEVFTVEQLNQIEKETNYLTGTTDLSAIDETILPSYLATAQKDFAWISYRLTGKFSGNLGPVTLWTLRLFIPNAKLPSIDESAFDPYSSGIAALVVSRVAERLKEEKKQIADYPIQRGEDRWTPTSPGYRGLNYGTAKTWYTQSSDEYIADAPPTEDDQWEDEVEEIESAMKNRTGKQTESVFYWANLTEIGAGDWDSILQNYFEEKHTPLAMRLYARALVRCAYADANAAAFHSKYTYWVQRPSQKTDSIDPLITVPNHPSYPSAHSTTSAAVALVLSDLFPSDRERWNQTSEESGMSRIYGGIHYPVDHTAGKKLGEQVGHAALEKSKQATQR